MLSSTVIFSNPFVLTLKKSEQQEAEEKLTVNIAKSCKFVIL